MFKNEKESKKFVKENNGRLLSEHRTNFGIIRNYKVGNELYHEFIPTQDDMKNLYYFLKVS